MIPASVDEATGMDTCLDEVAPVSRFCFDASRLNVVVEVLAPTLISVITTLSIEEGCNAVAAIPSTVVKRPSSAVSAASRASFSVSIASLTCAPVW